MSRLEANAQAPNSKFRVKRWLNMGSMPSGTQMLLKVSSPNSAELADSARLFLNPRFQPTIRLSLTTSQVLRRPPEVT